ncbi:MAG: hypothetical protein E6H58_08115 [Betaproteobacteria bacterium]|nr:MAG: hypothetical protein E6H58_08115 [Betaproteobacteria bacterium]
MRWTLCQLGPPIQYAQICGLLTLKLKSGRLEFAAERLGQALRRGAHHRRQARLVALHWQTQGQRADQATPSARSPFSATTRSRRALAQTAPGAPANAISTRPPAPRSSGSRFAVLKDVPTIAESGYKGFEATDWKALLAPAGTPADLVKRLNAEVEKALKQPETIAKLNAEGSEALGGSPQRFADFLKTEHARWGALVKESGAQVD